MQIKNAFHKNDNGGGGLTKWINGGNKGKRDRSGEDADKEQTSESGDSRAEVEKMDQMD